MLQLRADYRLGGIPRYYISDRDEGSMLVPDDVRECAAFIGAQTSAGRMLLGTAFFVMKESQEVDDLAYVYLVTAKHVIIQAIERGIDNKVYCRVNLKNGGSLWVKTDVSQWKFHPEDQSVDIAVMAFAPDGSIIEYRTIPEKMFATDEVVKRKSIGVGDEVFLTGLFINHTGRERNLPIVRTGNIALMPQEKIATAHFGSIDAYLIECRSIGGLSGSPVFVHISNIIPRYLSETIEPSNQYFLLGVMHGHWDMPIPAPARDNVIMDSLIREAVNMGVAIVIPVTKVSEVIDHPDFMQGRKITEAKLREERLPTLDSVHKTDEEETFTRDDFFKALKKASKPVEPDEEKRLGD